jgi:hypothetical protein
MFFFHDKLMQSEWITIFAFKTNYLVTEVQ